MVSSNAIKLGPNYYIHTKSDGISEAMSMYQILDCWHSRYLSKGCLFWMAEQQRWTLLADFLGEDVGPRTKMPKEIPPPPPQLATPKLPDKSPFQDDIEEILMEISALPQSERESAFRDRRRTLRELDSKLKAKVIYDYYFEINENLVGPITFPEIDVLRESNLITDNTPFWDYFSGTWQPFLEIRQRSNSLLKSLASTQIQYTHKYDETEICLLSKIGIKPNENV